MVQFASLSVMIYKAYKIYLFVSLLLCLAAKGQRVYRVASVLSSGVWSKISLKDPGVYKADVAFLSALGFNTTNLSSSSIRLFGNGGGMLSEANADIPMDDLQENAIMVVDGGDGIFNGNDYFLFYANGPDLWLKDSVNKKFTHRKNIYSDSAYYFITIGGTGKRINSLQINSLATATVNSFNERIFHELDTINLLSSGKEWFGEEFTNAPGKSLTRNFSYSLTGLQLSSPVTIISDCIARSVNAASRFDVQFNNQLVQQINIPSTGAGIYDQFAQQAKQSSTTTLSQENLQINYTYIPGSFNSQGWLNWFELHARKNLALPASGRLLFRDWNSVGNSVCEFVLSNANTTTQVWEVTDPLLPVNIQGSFSAAELKVKNDGTKLREYVAFNPANALLPVPSGRVQNQNLHDAQPADYLIVTHKTLLAQAERLAAFHRQKNNLKVLVVTTDQVFNEFSSGIPDPTAIRDFAKMYFDKFSGNTSTKPKYLLLFGDASFDYKNRVSNNTNLVPAYQSKVSLDPLSTYTSDDFFGFLNDNEDINSGLITNLLDIGIGRIPAKNSEEAKNYV
ncbi:MAG TPA: type IX secretion system sortase PorU, partial [Chitinophagaceae bacterium]|nr:type IX secretion system sortase PorU [Chitinophagaceae bacterium]